MRIRELKEKTSQDPIVNAENVIGFLHTHLNEYGDTREAIRKCLDYVFEKGGFVLTLVDENQIIAATIINDTGMEGYIPEHILVYIATHGDYRGKGLGKKLMKEAIERARGDIALHVEPQNPALHLYKKLGFTHKYLEMRLHKS